MGEVCRGVGPGDEDGGVGVFGRDGGRTGIVRVEGDGGETFEERGVDLEGSGVEDLHFGG